MRDANKYKTAGPRLAATRWPDACGVKPRRACVVGRETRHGQLTLNQASHAFELWATRNIDPHDCVHMLQSIT
eukprot:364833-Chlamydomonas_euryale.AAC.20